MSALPPDPTPNDTFAELIEFQLALARYRRDCVYKDSPDFPAHDARVAAWEAKLYVQRGYERTGRVR